MPRVIPLVNQFMYLQRAEINVGDYFCFLRLPLRVRDKFKIFADAFYEHQRENAKKLK